MIRGRVWIGLVAFALIGIVTLQLGLLKLNAGIGRALEHEALLQRENAALSIENSEMAAGNRIESRAAHLGMELVPAGALRFLTAHPSSDVAHGATALSAPAHTTTTGSAEAAGGGSGTSATSTASSPSSESSSSSESTTSSSAGESSAKAPEEGSAKPGGGEATGTSAEATQTTTPAAPTAPASSPSGSGASEAGSAGGTQAGPAG